MKTYDKVKQILTDDERSRNSDKRLTYKVAEKIVRSKGLNINLRDLEMLFIYMPPTESITRARRAIQKYDLESGKFELQPSAEIKKYRNRKQKSKGTFVFREK